MLISGVRSKSLRAWGKPYLKPTLLNLEGLGSFGGVRAKVWVSGFMGYRVVRLGFVLLVSSCFAKLTAEAHSLRPIPLDKIEDFGVHCKQCSEWNLYYCDYY